MVGEGVGGGGGGCGGPCGCGCGGGGFGCAAAVVLVGCDAGCAAGRLVSDSGVGGCQDVRGEGAAFFTLLKSQTIPLNPELTTLSTVPQT